MSATLIQGGRGAAEAPKELKICGFKTRGQVAAAMGAGVEYVGIVFVHGSRRYMGGDLAEVAAMAAEVDAARAAAPRQRTGLAPPCAVGVFERRDGVPLADEVAEINATCAQAGLHGAQLYGWSADEYDAAMRGRLHVGGVIFAASITEEADVARIRVPEDPLIRAVCVDKRVGTQLGGTGKSYDWDWLRRLPPAVAHLPFFLAGGVRLDNVPRARALPFVAVLDVSSAAEEDGEIAPRRVAALAAAVRRATSPASPGSSVGAESPQHTLQRAQQPEGSAAGAPLGA